MNLIYGLDYLENALAGAKFLYVNANVIDARTKQPMFTPYLIKDTEVVDKTEKTDAEDWLYWRRAAANHGLG